jgi:UDP-N-acetylmuramoylalanine--D-glutamate ligase
VILGFGREGRDTFRFFKKLLPEKKISIADQKFSKNYLEKLKDYDVIVKSPGIPFKVLQNTDLCKITTQTEIFFENCPGKIIGITGTKGKSTTAFWIYQALKRGGVKVHLLGNIGKPVLTSLLKAKKNDVFVYELSSHQLCNLSKSPHIAVLLNIYPEHLDYYRSFKEYVRAKANIAKYQTQKDYLIYNVEDSLVKEIAQKSKAKKIPIRGKYYRLNAAAARAVAEIFKVPLPKKLNFLPHRLEYLGKFKGIAFYNDSLSTVPQTAIEALDFLGDKVKTLILGGYDRGLDFKELARRIEKSWLKNLILFPTTGKRIKNEIKNKKIACFFVKTMKEAVKLAYENTEKGGICLLSPASASFGIFKDYADRGEQFKKFVKMLK